MVRHTTAAANLRIPVKTSTAPLEERTIAQKGKYNYKGLLSKKQGHGPP